ncbi:hypothetical protein G6011_09095 [Alternaria panax]|uniref:Uncharacterized protein n=1 Tax=Alternaria panax TaxID=48097 RepID=A0AAD4IAF9_9PLEO|nr:hypothetical protein G6011_09095 [Alternaria panax]
MFLKTILVASALLFSTTHAVAQATAPDFTPGRCSFDAVVSQDCDNNQIITFLDVSPVYDGAGNQFMEQTDFIDLTDGLGLTAVVVGKELKIGFERDSVSFRYGDAHWPNKHNNGEFSCSTKPWDGSRLDCNNNDRIHRSQALSCKFDCAIPSPKSSMKRVRNEPLPDILASPPESVANADSAANYAPGFCSFKLQLFQQCLHTPSEGWHNQMLGMLYSVEDQNRVIAATYPEGTGRIDGRSVRLGGMGGLKVAYNPEDRQAYFQFEPKGGFWSTLTLSTPDAVGMCDWKPWTRDETGCDEKRQNDHPRLSDMTCGFFC